MGKPKLSIEEMRKIAKNNGGECLSKKYLNSKSKLRWKCKKGHKWEATPNSVKRGSWCIVCANNKKSTIKEMRKLAREKGGKCLSEVYINNHTKLKWQCKKWHTWSATPHDIRAGHWCPKCARVQKLTIIEMRKIAKSRGGKCLSKKYINSQTKLKWVCKEGHTWFAKAAHVLPGSWCPICSEGINERICRKCFEVILGEKFPKKHPSWLISSKGKRMELDGYCEKLKLAFEYQGIQHYQKIDFFHGKIRYPQRKKDDMLKRKLCKANGIMLIEIPHTIKLERIGEYIINECKKRKIHIPKTHNVLDLATLDVFSPTYFKEMQEIAKERDGRLLSKNYMGMNVKLKWQCKEGHVWEATPNHIKSGEWCPICGIQKRADSIRLNIKEMQELAKSKGGKCLSSTYLTANSKLRWECKEGHVWAATPGNIKSGKWCRICGRIRAASLQKSTIEDMRKLAKKKKGKCLSEIYINARSKLKWQCKEGHVWTTTPDHIQAGGWCPICANTERGKARRLTIQEMQTIARDRGGRCLSKEYTNSETKLKWRCKEGHMWAAIPMSIKRGTWCPRCGNIQKALKKIKNTIEDMQELAKKRGGKCLSEKYINSETKLRWQCKEGHVWEATPHNIKRRRWCPICMRGGERRKIEH